MDHRFVSLVVVVSCATLLFFHNPVQAASNILIVVTPTVEKEPQGSVAKKAPTSFSDVITPGPESSGLIDTQEALRKASSVDLSDYGGAQTSPVTLRGSDFQQTLIMLDGIPLNPVTGDIVDLSRYMLPDIEQIEIVKGSNSAAFGKSAMGGVVNLVTRNPSPVDEYDFTASQGTYGYGLYHGHLSTHAGPFGIMANITHAFAENDYRYEQDDGTWVRRENNDIVNTTGLIKALIDVQGWQTSFMGNMIDQQSGSPGSEGTAGLLTPEDKVNTVQDTFLVETHKVLPQDQAVSLRAWMQTNRTHTESIPFGNSITRLTNESMSASYTKDAGPLSLTPGVAYLLERMSSEDYGIHSRSTATGSLSTSLDAKPVFLELSGRYDDSSDFQDRWSYHAGAAWKFIEHVQIKANVGTGYREPTMGQLYTPSTWYTFIPNPALKPERSFGWDIGPSVSMNTFGFGVDYFLTTYRDLIKMEFPAPNTFTYANVDKARAWGVEANAWVAPIDMVMFSANYLLSRYTYESGPYEGKELKQKPPQVFNLQADYLPEIAGRSTTFSLSYQFREGSFADEANTLRTDNRSILNAGAVLDVNRNAKISFKVDNLLDDRSPEYMDKTPFGTFWYPVPGRTYRFAAKVIF
jgi:vitamin B12 transporter